MTPKEMAVKLLDKHRTIIRKADLYGYLVPSDEIFLAKESAIITANRIISDGNLEPQLKRHIGNVPPMTFHLEYWFEVVKELLKKDND